MLYAFIYGAILALGLIVPLGIQNIFIFNQGATQHHFLHAMPSVMTAIICDAILIIAAVLGVSVVVLSLPWLKTLMYLVGFVFLIYMGITTWYKTPSHSHAGEKPLSTKSQILFSMSVSLLNPHALLDTIGVIGTNSLQFVGLEKMVFTAACIVISACWFFSLSVAGHFLHKMDTTGRFLYLINKASAFIILSMAGYIGWLLISPYYDKMVF